MDTYETPKIISVPSYFNNFKYATTIARKGHGLVGIKDNHTKEELARGLMPWHIVKLKGYEMKMLNQDRTINQFPEDKIERFNKILKWTPRPIRKLFRKQIREYGKKLTDAW